MNKIKTRLAVEEAIRKNCLKCRRFELCIVDMHRVQGLTDIYRAFEYDEKQIESVLGRCRDQVEMKKRR